MNKEKRKYNTKFRDLRGQKFGFLTPIIRQGTTSYKKVIWLCRCDCGRKTKAHSGHLISGARISCGCKKLDKTQYIYDIKDILVQEKRNQYKKNAKKRKFEYNLTDLEFKELILSNCYYCDESPSNVFKRKRRVFKETFYTEIKYNGVDRVNSDLGYFKDNCVSCCKICNVAKNDMLQEDFLNWVNKIYNYQISK